MTNVRENALSVNLVRGLQQQQEALLGVGMLENAKNFVWSEPMWSQSFPFRKRRSSCDLLLHHPSLDRKWRRLKTWTDLKFWMHGHELVLKRESARCCSPGKWCADHGKFAGKRSGSQWTWEKPARFIITAALVCWTGICSHAIFMLPGVLSGFQKSCWRKELVIHWCLGGVRTRPVPLWFECAQVLALSSTWPEFPVLHWIRIFGLTYRWVVGLTYNWHPENIAESFAKAWLWCIYSSVVFIVVTIFGETLHCSFFYRSVSGFHSRRRTIWQQKRKISRLYNRVAFHQLGFVQQKLEYKAEHIFLSFQDRGAAWLQCWWTPEQERVRLLSRGWQCYAAESLQPPWVLIYCLWPVDWMLHNNSQVFLCFLSRERSLTEWKIWGFSCFLCQLNLNFGF